jgi:hypothetical protein
MRASFAHHPPELDGATWLEPLTDESLAAIRLHRLPRLWRRRPRATMRVWHLAEDFAITVAA